MIILLIIRIRITNLMVVIMPRLTSCYLVSLEIEAGADPYIPRNLFILDTRTRGFNSTLDRRMGLIIYQIIGRVQFYARQQDGFNSILNTRTGSILYNTDTLDGFSSILDTLGRVQFNTRYSRTGSILYSIQQNGFFPILDTLGEVQFYSRFSSTGSILYHILQAGRVQFNTGYQKGYGFHYNLSQIHQDGFNSILDTLGRFQFYTRSTRKGSILNYIHQDGFNSILDTLGRFQFYTRYIRSGLILYQIHQDGSILYQLHSILIKILRHRFNFLLNIPKILTMGKNIFLIENFFFLISLLQFSIDQQWVLGGFRI